MRQPKRMMILGVGFVWSELLLVAGYGLLFATQLPASRLIPAVGLLGGGLFVAMWLVIDPLVPNARQWAVTLLQGSCLCLFLVSACVLVYGVLTGQATMLFFPL